VFNLHTAIVNDPVKYRQFQCGDSLITLFNCPLENKFADTWSHFNYIVKVMDGRKVWHTANKSFDLGEGSCVFVRKGATIIEQFFDVNFCVVLFFLPDEFICDVLKSKSLPVQRADKSFETVMPICNDDLVEAFFQSMMTYFGSNRKPDPSLLELKFRELILTIAGNPANADLLSYFHALLKEPHQVSIQKVMEENFCFNLQIEEFARLCNRSVSAFKRDFRRAFETTPGKWLMEKRLNHARHLLANRGKTVSEAAFESGFESPSHFSRSFKQRFGMPPTSVKHQLHH
jgi:AraC-like DNA-binding protein